MGPNTCRNIYQLGPVLKCHLILGPHEPFHLSTSVLCFNMLNWPRQPHSQNSYITPGIQIQPNLVEVVDLIWIVSAYEKCRHGQRDLSLDVEVILWRAHEDLETPFHDPKDSFHHVA